MTPDEVYEDQQAAIAEGAFDTTPNREIAVTFHLTLTDSDLYGADADWDLAKDIAREIHRMFPAVIVADYEVMSHNTEGTD